MYRILQSYILLVHNYEMLDNGGCNEDLYLISHLIILVLLNVKESIKALYWISTFFK